MAIAEWPATAYAQVMAGDVIPVALAVGGSVYLMGVPSTASGLQALATQYAATGVMLIAADAALSAKQQSAAAPAQTSS